MNSGHGFDPCTRGLIVRMGNHQCHTSALPSLPSSWDRAWGQETQRDLTFESAKGCKQERRASRWLGEALRTVFHMLRTPLSLYFSNSLQTSHLAWHVFPCNLPFWCLSSLEEISIQAKDVRMMNYRNRSVNITPFDIAMKSGSMGHIIKVRFMKRWISSLEHILWYMKDAQAQWKFEWVMCLRCATTRQY